MDAVERQIMQLLLVPEIGSAIKASESPDDAAQLLVKLAGDKGQGLDVATVSRAFSKSESQGLGELSDEDLTAVSGGMAASGGGRNTGGHTQCCYHCYP